MRSVIVAFGVWLIALAALADEPTAPVPTATTAIERGLNFLAKDSLAWKEAHNCASCHHAGMVVWAMREAKLRGYAVDEPVLAEMTQWMANSGDGKISVERPASAPHAISTKALYFALALESDP